MNITSEMIKEMLASEGIDKIGIANADELLLAYPQRPATALMPSAKSLIVMMVPHTLGSVYAPDIMLWTRSKMQTSRILDHAAEKMGRFLEKQGFLSLPVSADKPAEIHKFNPETGRKFNQTRSIGFLSHKHAAISCGLGELGKNNLLLTPEYGPHQRLCAIITEAPLEPDPRREFNLCKGCNLCEKACPSGALKDGKYEVDPCFNYWSYGIKKRNPVRFRQWPAFLNEIRKTMKNRDLLVESGQTYITDVDNCIECMRVCRVGTHWKNIRPEKLPPMKSGGTS